MAGQLDFNAEDYFEGDNIGYYQYVNMTEMLNDFMATKVGGGKLIDKCSRTEVEWHMQRAVQEFSYDILRPISSLEEELIDGMLSIKVPQNLVSILGVSFIDSSGFRHPVPEQRYASNAVAPLRDNNNELIYDDDGELTYGNESPGIQAFQNSGSSSDVAQEFYNYYAGSFENDELYDRYYSYYGRRFGSEPEATQLNGNYVYDQELGVLFFDSALSESAIAVDYITDGLDVDKNKIKVHKFAEEAIYSYVLWKMVGNMRNMPLYEKQLAEKMYVADKRRAKLRLSGINPKALFNVLKNKSKWIKH